MPDCMLIERAEKYNVREINSVNMFSDSGSSRQRMNSFSVSMSSLRTQLISSNCQVLSKIAALLLDFRERILHG